MTEAHIETLEKIKNYKKEMVLVGLYQYQIKAIIDFSMNKVTYQVGQPCIEDSFKSFNILEEAIDEITKLIESDPTCER